MEPAKENSQDTTSNKNNQIPVENQPCSYQIVEIEDYHLRGLPITLKLITEMPEIAEAEVIEDTPEVLAESTLSGFSQNPSQGQIVPASFANCEQMKQQTTADRVRKQWEKTGVIPKIPMEYEEWARADLGADVIASYRKSGRITTNKAGDIDPNFAVYISKQYPGKDIDYAYSYIKKLERQPEQWEILRALVLKWKVSQQANNPNLNVAVDSTRNTDRVRRTFNFR